jgi:nitroreductase
MDVTEALYTTRAMRRIKPDPVPDEVIARIVDAGVRAPSPGDPQAWRFVVVTQRETMARLGAIWREARDALLVARPDLYASEVQARSSQYLHDHFDELPLLIAGYGPAGMGHLTVVPAMWGMCIAARAEGVGSVFTTLLVSVEAKVNEVLGVPADSGMGLVAVTPMGYPLGRWGVARRQPAHEVAFADSWGTPPAWTAETPSFG